MVRVVQISDTHLSPGKRHFTDNWPPLAAWIKAQAPDLVIHTGDLTIDGADLDVDLHYCAGLLTGLGVPYRVVPGNHDVGDSNHKHQPVSAARIARWSAVFGDERWVHDSDGWRLIGLDGMLIGSGIPQEAAHFAWACDALAQAAGRRIALFLHRPLFLASPDEGDTGYWSVKPAQRRQWLSLIRQYDVGLVASGHLHKAHHFMLHETRYVWAPSSAFLCGPTIQPDMPGEKRLGAVLYEFAGPDCQATVIEVPGLTPHWIDDVLEEVYPRHTDVKPG